MKMKKTTLIMLASASILFAVESEVNTTIATTPVMKVIQLKSATSKMCKRKPCNINMSRMRKNKMREESPFLIKHGLPYLTKMIMPYMDNPAFGLTAEQIDRLLKLKVSTMHLMGELQPEVMALRQTIIDSSMLGISADDLREKVARLALLQGTATMTQLKCIEETKKILTKDQLVFLLVHQTKRTKKTRNKQMSMRKMKNK